MTERRAASAGIQEAGASEAAPVPPLKPVTSTAPSPIVGIVVTATTVAPDASYTPFAKLPGIYLWYKRLSEGEKIEPITAVNVVYGSGAAVTEGYEKLNDDLVRAEDKNKSVFLTFSRVKDKGPPIIDLKIINEEENIGKISLELSLN